MEEKTFKNVIEVKVNSNYFVILSINLNLRSESEHARGVDQVRYCKSGWSGHSFERFT